MSETLLDGENVSVKNGGLCLPLWGIEGQVDPTFNQRAV